VVMMEGSGTSFVDGVGVALRVSVGGFVVGRCTFVGVDTCLGISGSGGRRPKPGMTGRPEIACGVDPTL
jgi:hypothetical protein